jgi:hypothetical protein
MDAKGSGRRRFLKQAAALAGAAAAQVQAQNGPRTAGSPHATACGSGRRCPQASGARDEWQLNSLVRRQHWRAWVSSADRQAGEDES